MATQGFRGDERVTQPCCANTTHSSESSAQEADEAQYRWYPLVNGSNINEEGSFDGEFETLRRNLPKVSLPSPPPSSGSTTRCLAHSGSSSSCSSSNREANHHGGRFYNKTNSCSNKNLAALGSMANHAQTSTASAQGTQELTHGNNSNAGSNATINTTTLQLLFLVRHGQTDLNAQGRLQGRGVNAHLNKVGQDQVEGLGRFVRNVPFDTVTSSSLHRAHETAIRVAELNVRCIERTQKNGNPADGDASSSSLKDKNSTPWDFFCSDRAQVLVKKYEDLDELSWGELEGEESAKEPWKTKLAELKADWDNGHFDRAAKGGESVLEVEARALRGLEKCLDRGKYLNLVACHGRTLRIIMLSLAGLGLDQMSNMGKIPNAGLYIMEARQAGSAPRSYRLLTPSNK